MCSSPMCHFLGSSLREMMQESGWEGLPRVQRYIRKRLPSPWRHSLPQGPSLSTTRSVLYALGTLSVSLSALQVVVLLARTRMHGNSSFHPLVRVDIWSIWWRGVQCRPGS